MLIKQIFLILFLCMMSAEAAPFERYFEEAGRDFGIDPSLLKRIATIESSLDPNAINHNKNGTSDIGLMQINTIHLRRLSKVGVTRESLLDPQVNIYVGALLLSSHIRKRGYNLDAIGCYHSANPVYKNQWLKRLALAEIPNAQKDASVTALRDDPRTRFAQSQLSTRMDEKIAQGMNPKKAWREAKAEVDHLLGYTS
ncbi:MAG: lytic transglycosylase domain-containing protein [Sulfuricurvum sp.]|nr:lytic transglycosylase domain-containing protein [Sulfuricurvum sp.]